MKTKQISKLMATLLLVLLAACGGGGSPAVSTPEELGELVNAVGEADAEVRLEVLRSYKPTTLTTQFNPEAGAQTVYEVAGTTPKGKAFKAVLLGDEGLQLGEFKGNMRMKARLRRIQGQAVLTGRLIPTGAAAQAITGRTPIAFVAGGQNVRFSGPAEGSVYEWNGLADFKGTCDADGLSGSYSYKQDRLEVEGSLNGVKLKNQAVPCVAGAVEAQVPIALSYTAVETHMGVIFSAQGSLVTGAGSSTLGSQAAAPMPASGISVSSPVSSGVNKAVVRTKSNVKELGQASGAELVSFNSTTGTAIFNTLAGNLRGLTEGDIIASAPRTGALDGFLRKVTRVQNTNDGKVEVRTSRADLSEMADELDVEVEQNYSTADFARAAALKQGEVIYAASQVGPSMQALGKIDIDKTVVLYDQDGNNSTTDDQVTLRGDIEITPKLIVKLKCSGAFCSDPTFTSKFVLDETAAFTVSAKLKREISETKQIARITLGAIAIGPVVLVPEFVINLNLDGVIRVEIEFGVTQSLNIEAGLTYDKDTGFRKINKVTTSVTRTGPTFEGSVELTASITADLRLMLWGVAGVSAGVELYVDFNAQYPGTPAWTITPGIRGTIGLDLDLIIFRKEYNQTLFDTVFTDQKIVAPNDRPNFVEVGSKYQCDDGYSARVGVGLNGALAPVTLYALTDDKEDGAGRGTIDWSSSRDGSLGRTRRADKHTLRTALSNGTHTITALLTDSANGTRSREFTVQLANNRCQFPAGLPDVNITSDDNPDNLPFPPLIVINTSGELTLRAQTAVGTLGTCLGELRWKSNLERRNAGTSAGGSELIPGTPARLVCSHTFTNTYKNLSPQTITAKYSYNGMTVTDSIEVGALIPLTLNIGNISSTAPSGTRYVYAGDTVSFSATGSNLTWSSSVETDNINGRSGNSVSGVFSTIGPRTIVARTSNSSGGFDATTININVLSALAKR